MSEALKISFLTDDQGSTGVRGMIQFFLSRAESREEAGLSLARIFHVVFNVLMLAVGQPYVPKQNHQSNKGKKALKSQHV
jgi:hypothetical protein